MEGRSHTTIQPQSIYPEDLTITSLDSNTQQQEKTNHSPFSTQKSWQSSSNRTDSLQQKNGKNVGAKYYNLVQK